MDKKSTFIIAGLLGVAVLVFVFISFQKSTFDTQDPISRETASTTEWENAPAISPEIEISSKTVVTAKHAFRNSLHTVAGEVPLPTPCHVLDAKTVVSADKKSVILQLVSSIKSGESCPPNVTPARFKVTAKADKSANITAIYNGKDVALNLIEAEANEDLDNFELYIKG